MNADLDYITGRIPTYRGYTDEADRHDSMKRVRAIIGETLTDVYLRLGAGLDAVQAAQYETLLLACMFDDQSFVHKIEHATLNEGQQGELIAADRGLVELEERLNATTTPADFAAVIAEIQARFAARAGLLPTI